MRKRIRNIIDVITNSSDEVYLLKTDEDPDFVVSELRRVLGPERSRHYSGMGGILRAATIATINDFEYPEDYQWLPEGYMLVCIDHGYTDYLVPWLKENFEVIDNQAGFRLEWIRKGKEEAEKRLAEAIDDHEISEAYDEYMNWVRLEEEEIDEEF